MELDIKVVQAQTRLLKAYSGFRNNGGYRAVAERVGVNVSYIYDLCVKNQAPSNPEVLERILNWRPDGEERKTMDGTTQKLFDLMRVQHVGRSQAIKSRELVLAVFGAVAVDNSKNNPYDRKIREMVEEINHDFEGMICSTPADGYFWASSLNEGLGATSRLKKRAMTQLGNVSHLEGNLKRRFGGQLELGSKEWYDSVPEIEF